MNIPSHVDVIRTNLALVLHTQAMQLVQPVGNRFAVPTQGKLKRVVYSLFFLFFLRCAIRVRGRGWRSSLLHELLLTLSCRQRKFALYIGFGFVEDGSEGDEEGGGEVGVVCGVQEAVCGRGGGNVVGWCIRFFAVGVYWGW